MVIIINEWQEQEGSEAGEGRIKIIALVSGAPAETALRVVPDPPLHPGTHARSGARVPSSRPLRTPSPPHPHLQSHSRLLSELPERRHLHEGPGPARSSRGSLKDVIPPPMQQLSHHFHSRPRHQTCHHRRTSLQSQNLRRGRASARPETHSPSSRPHYLSTTEERTHSQREGGQVSHRQAA